MAAKKQDVSLKYLGIKLGEMRDALHDALVEDPSGPLFVDDKYFGDRMSNRFRLKENPTYQETVMFHGALAIQGLLLESNDPNFYHITTVLIFAMMAERYLTHESHSVWQSEENRRKRLGKGQLKDMEELVLRTAYLRNCHNKDWLQRVTAEVVQHRGGQPVSTKTVSRELRKRGIVTKS
jgi:hypothetical protein